MRMVFRETLNKLIPFLARPFDKLTAHHERNQHLVVRPDPSATLRTKGLVKGLNQGFLSFYYMAAFQL